MIEEMSKARKLFRLFKWLFEYEKVRKLLTKPPADLDEIDIILGKKKNNQAIVTRLFFAGYWIFDNLVIISTIKLLKRDPAIFKKPAGSFWFLALLVNLIANLRILKKSEKQINFYAQLVK